jgi:para-aminobenzoate synthetase/4-amino-4-deoxychorismate lyase
LKNPAVIFFDVEKKIFLKFDKPVKVISAGRINQVISALKLVEEYVREKKCYAAGFLSYEAAPAFDKALRTKEIGDFPLLWFGIYEKPVVLDSVGGTGNLLKNTPRWKADINRYRYKEDMAVIKGFIERGDTYQVNFTYRLKSNFSCDAYDFFSGIIGKDIPPYSAFIETDEWAICSFSPELFFCLEGDNLISRPMKGTAPRGFYCARDKLESERLFNSDKERAENIMIVDMMRNDMGRISEYGSVEVRDLFKLEKHPYVWQMTSTVSSKTKSGISEIFKAMFPSASVTGAPKARTMEIISELEKTPRKVYTGSMGFVEPAGRAVFNVAIRSVLIDKNRRTAEYGTGSGIVWDSTAEKEFEECGGKTGILIPGKHEFSLIESILWEKDKGFFLLDRHIKRLSASADFFSFRVDIRRIKELLAEEEKKFTRQKYKVRLTVSKNGFVSISAEFLPGGHGEKLQKVAVALKPVNTSDIFLYHKTTNRAVYDQASGSRPEYDDVILFNESGELTESTIANVILDMGGRLFTPPVSSGLLAGTFRDYLIGLGKLEEQVLRLNDLRECDDIYLANSIRRLYKVKLSVPECSKVKA